MWKKKRIKFSKKENYWAIGIYRGLSPFEMGPDKKIRNPVLSAADVTDVIAEFVADPFMVWEGNTWYMFFEVSLFTFPIPTFSSTAMTTT